jgi:hypothetical protein
MYGTDLWERIKLYSYMQHKEIIGVKYDVDIISPKQKHRE